MVKKTNTTKALLSVLVAALLATVTQSVFAARLPASKTQEQQLLEDKETAEQTVTEDESIPPADWIAIENLPEDTTPRYTLNRIEFSGNTLIADEALLEDIPDIFNASRKGLQESIYLFDLRPVKVIAAEPGTETSISARSIQGFNQHIVSVYQNRHYAGIYVYVPQDAFEADGALSKGILPIRILEAPVTQVSSAYYDPNNQPVEEGYLNVNALYDWSPVKEGRVINRKKLDDYINLLNLNPDRYVSATISRGTEPNSLSVNYNVYEANPWHFFVQVDNSGTDDIQWRPRFGLINTNLLGYDDKLTAVYQVTPDSTWDEGYAVFGSYDFPIMGPKLRLNLYAGYSQFNIPDPSLINFVGNGSFAGGILRYNALQFDDWFWDVTGSISYERSRITTDLSALFPGIFLTSDIHMTLWGLGTELYKTTDMTDTFLGFNTYGLLNSSDAAAMAGTRSGGASDDFRIYQLTGRHSRYLDTDKIQRLSASARLIVADDRLVPSKMTTFGGMYTIRGYDESDTIADGGLISSVQYEYDLVRSEQIELFGQDVDEKKRKPFLRKLAPLAFFDYGLARIENALATENDDTEFASIGCGLITELGDNFTGTIYYGHPLIGTDNTETDDGHLHVGLLLRW